MKMSIAVVCGVKQMKRKLSLDSEGRRDNTQQQMRDAIIVESAVPKTKRIRGVEIAVAVTVMEKVRRPVESDTKDDQIEKDRLLLLRTENAEIYRVALVFR